VPPPVTRFNTCAIQRVVGRLRPIVAQQNQRAATAPPPIHWSGRPPGPAQLKQAAGNGVNTGEPPLVKFAGAAGRFLRSTIQRMEIRETPGDYPALSGGGDTASAIVEVKFVEDRDFVDFSYSTQEYAPGQGIGEKRWTGWGVTPGRQYDSEAKVCQEICDWAVDLNRALPAETLSSISRVTVKIYSTEGPCDSCRAVIDELERILVIQFHPAEAVVNELSGRATRKVAIRSSAQRRFTGRSEMQYGYSDTDVVYTTGSTLPHYEHRDDPMRDEGGSRIDQGGGRY
jgi:hypothetical protein